MSGSNVDKLNAFAAELGGDHVALPCNLSDAAAVDGLLGREPADLGGPRPLSREFFEAQMEVVVAERVPVYAAGLGNPEPWMARLKANGTVVLAVVAGFATVAFVAFIAIRPPKAAH